MLSDAKGVGMVPPARMTVRLLGAAEVNLDGQRLRAFNSLRLQRFLALIVLRRKPQPRAKLAFELWPDSDESQARTNLRKLLHDLRQSLPESDKFVEIDNETVGWLATGLSEVDVLRFQDAIASGDLDLASRLYAGDLLPACYDDWVLRERDGLRQEAYKTLGRLVEESAKRGDHQGTLRYSQRIVDLEPTDEAAIQAQMNAYLALDDRAGALRTYHHYAETLERDLDLVPGEEICNLYSKLRGGLSDLETILPDNLAIASESPFIGRDFEWKQLLEAWKSAREGKAHLLLIGGEAGVGKSRLAQEFGRWVRAEGFPYASARAYEAAGRLPWGPVVDLLRSDALHSYVDSLDTVWRAELARLMPELLDSGEAPGQITSSDAIQRHRMFDAVSRAIVACNRPCLLVIDDLQWCDTETIESIGYVVQSKSTAPVLIVGTFRSEEISVQHPLNGLIDALARDHAVTNVRLGRLDEATTAALASSMCGENSLDPELETRLWHETEGNPLFVIEALRAGISADDRQAVLTPTIRAVLRARLDRLSDGARHIAEVAAVIGRPFSAGLLATATGVDETGLVDEIDELWRRRIIREQGTRYDFSHDKIRTIALELISPARRRQFHRSVAEALVVESKNDPDAASPRLAAHYDAAGMVEAAIEAYHVAGIRAVAVSALSDAVGQFRRALELLADVSPSPARDELELDIRIAFGSPLVALEGYGSPDAHQLYERALVLCRRLAKPVDPPILRGLGLARLQGCRFDNCDKLAQALVEHESGDSIARTEGRYLLGVSAFWQGKPGAARRDLTAAIDTYELSRRDEHLASYAQDPKAICLVRLGLAELWIGDLERAEASAQSALELAVELDHLMTLGYVYTYASILAAESENLSWLGELLENADLLWRRLSEHYLVIVLDALRGWLEVRGGSAAGVEKIVESVSRSRHEGETLHLTYTLLLLARARALTGELHKGRAAIRDALECTHHFNQRYLEAELWRIDGELAYHSGESDSAMASFRNAVEIASSQGAAWLELRALHSLTSRSSDRETRERLETLIETLPSGQDLPAFRAITEFLQESG